MNKKLLKIAALLVSISLVGWFVAYRSGYFRLPQKKITAAYADTEPVLDQKDSTISVTVTNNEMKDTLKQAFPPDFKLLPPDFPWLSKFPSKKIINFTLPDTLFKRVDSTGFAFTKLWRGDTLQFRFMLQTPEDERKLKEYVMGFVSTKSMVVFNPSDIKYEANEYKIHLTNAQYLYEEEVDYTREETNRVYNFDIYLSTEQVKKIKSINSKNTSAPLISDSINKEKKVRMLSSKYGRIFKTADVNTDSIDVKRDTIPN
jgi:hypothetical protein